MDHTGLAVDKPFGCCDWTGRRQGESDKGEHDKEHRSTLQGDRACKLSNLEKWHGSCQGAPAATDVTMSDVTDSGRPNARMFYCVRLSSCLLASDSFPNN